MPASVRIVPREGGLRVTAELVDVSAGGLRAHCPADSRLAAGVAVDVEITVRHQEPNHQPPVVNLRGSGRVVRIDSAHDDETYDASLRFTGPLEMREPFSQLLLF